MNVNWPMKCHGRMSERNGTLEGWRSRGTMRRPNVYGKVLELRCIVGKHCGKVCLWGLRSGLLPAIGGRLPQLCVSRISDGGSGERKEDGKGTDRDILE